jgi:hypothetical protein
VDSASAVSRGAFRAGYAQVKTCAYPGFFHSCFCYNISIRVPHRGFRATQIQLGINKKSSWKRAENRTNEFAVEHQHLEVEVHNDSPAWVVLRGRYCSSSGPSAGP